MNRLTLRKLLIVALPGCVALTLSIVFTGQLGAQQTDPTAFDYYAPLQIREARSQQEPDDVSPSDRPVPQQEERTRQLPTLADIDIRLPIMDLKFGINNEPGTVPKDESVSFFTENPSSNYPGIFQPRLAMWRAPDIRYQPLYFEDVNLERYGYQCGDFFQPFVSGVHFGLSSALLLPNALLCEHPGKCVYPLGFCRPGSCAPETKTRWIWNP